MEYLPVTELGVFAKRQILKRTQFGPFVAPSSAEPPNVASAGRFMLMVSVVLVLWLNLFVMSVL